MDVAIWILLMVAVASIVAGAASIWAEACAERGTSRRFLQAVAVLMIANLVTLCVLVRVERTQTADRQEQECYDRGGIPIRDDNRVRTCVRIVNEEP